MGSNIHYLSKNLLTPLSDNGSGHLAPVTFSLLFREQPWAYRRRQTEIDSRTVMLSAAIELRWDGGPFWEAGANEHIGYYDKVTTHFNSGGGIVERKRETYSITGISDGSNHWQIDSQVVTTTEIPNTGDAVDSTTVVFENQYNKQALYDSFFNTLSYDASKVVFTGSVNAQIRNYSALNGGFRTRFICAVTILMDGRPTSSVNSFYEQIRNGSTARSSSSQPSFNHLVGQPFGFYPSPFRDNTIGTILRMGFTSWLDGGSVLNSPVTSVLSNPVPIEDSHMDQYAGTFNIDTPLGEQKALDRALISKGSLLAGPGGSSGGAFDPSVFDSETFPVPLNPHRRVWYRMCSCSSSRQRAVLKVRKTINRRVCISQGMFLPIVCGEYAVYSETEVPIEFDMSNTSTGQYCSNWLLVTNSLGFPPTPPVNSLGSLSYEEFEAEYSHEVDLYERNEDDTDWVLKSTIVNMPLEEYGDCCAEGGIVVESKTVNPVNVGFQAYDGSNSYYLRETLSSPFPDAEGYIEYDIDSIRKGVVRSRGVMTKGSEYMEDFTPHNEDYLSYAVTQPFDGGDQASLIGYYKRSLVGSDTVISPTQKTTGTNIFNHAMSPTPHLTHVDITMDQVVSSADLTASSPVIIDSLGPDEYLKKFDVDLISHPLS